MKIITSVLLILTTVFCFGQKEDKIGLTGSAVVFTITFDDDSVRNTIYIDSVWGLWN